MRKFLLLIKVLQVRTYKEGRLEKRRINPYNPLSYVCVAIASVMALFWVGINGMVENSYNPFKWQ